jgi:hypothetical protein
MNELHRGVPQDAFFELTCLLVEFYACLNRRGDALVEPSDALLCADGPVKMLVKPSLVRLSVSMDTVRGVAA